MKDSQPPCTNPNTTAKYIKANNERFSTSWMSPTWGGISISRRIMKDSQPFDEVKLQEPKYIKANNERFSTAPSTGQQII